MLYTFGTVNGFIGGLLGVVTFLTTLTIFPFVQYYQLDLGRAFLSSLGFFLLKDLALLAACFEIARNNSLGIDAHSLR